MEGFFLDRNIRGYRLREEAEASQKRWAKDDAVESVRIYKRTLSLGDDHSTTIWCTVKIYKQDAELDLQLRSLENQATDLRRIIRRGY